MPHGASPNDAPSRGGLEIVPLPASGITIDSALWMTHVGSEDIGVWEDLVYLTFLRADHVVDSNQFALVYQAPGVAPVIDADLRPMRPGVPAATGRQVRLRSGLRITKTSALRWLAIEERSNRNGASARRSRPPARETQPAESA